MGTCDAEPSTKRAVRRLIASPVDTLPAVVRFPQVLVSNARQHLLVVEAMPEVVHTARVPNGMRPAIHPPLVDVALHLR